MLNTFSEGRLVHLRYLQLPWLGSCLALAILNSKIIVGNRCKPAGCTASVLTITELLALVRCLVSGLCADKQQSFRSIPSLSWLMLHFRTKSRCTLL